MNPENAGAIRRFPRPITKKHLQQFLGLTGFFRRFIRDYAERTVIFNTLLKNVIPFTWTQDHQKAFQGLKTALLESDMLQLPNFDHPFVIESDASDEGLGAMLSQRYDGETKVIEFFSRTLKDREKRYSTFEKEAMA